MQHTESIEDLRQRAKQFATAELAPHAATWDEGEVFPERSYQAMCEAGFVGLTVDQRYGGQGRGVPEACVILEELARGCMASALTLQMNVNGPPRVIARFGSEEQRERLLVGAADGSRYFAIAMTEPQAGSDGLALATTLTPDRDGYRLDGDKCHITGGARADTFLVFCRAPGTTGPHGVGAVVVESSAPGFQPPEVEPKMGGRGVAEAVLRFDSVRVAAEDVVIEPVASSKRGAAILLRQFNPERCGNAAMSVGIAQAAFDYAAAYAKERQQFGRRLVDFQGMQWKFADMAVALEASRLLVQQAASTDDDGFPATRETMIAKLHANEMVQRVTNEAIQILGHKGYLRRHPVERLFRDARGLALGGGTSEIMRNVIAGEVLGERFSQRG